MDAVTRDRLIDVIADAISWGPPQDLDRVKAQAALDALLGACNEQRCSTREDDHELALHPWPVRTKVWLDEWYADLDAGIRFAVRTLHARGYETCQSCEAGEGHAYDQPTVDLIAGDDAAGFAAVATLVGVGLPVSSVAQVWNLDALGRPFETVWRIQFKRAFPERADEVPMFVWGYQAQPLGRTPETTPMSAGGDAHDDLPQIPQPVEIGGLSGPLPVTARTLATERPPFTPETPRRHHEND